MAKKNRKVVRFGLPRGKNSMKFKRGRCSMSKHSKDAYTNMVYNPRRPLKVKIVKKNVLDLLQRQRFRCCMTGNKVVLKKCKQRSLDGYRIFNMDLLKVHITEISIHTALCTGAASLAAKNESPISLVSELKSYGLASIILARCNGCLKTFHINTSPKVESFNKQKRFDINLRGVWGTIATGGGAARLNEMLATMGVHGMSQTAFSSIEEEIGEWWQDALREELLANGKVEWQLAKAKSGSESDIQDITVIADGGWSKRSHKHSYNALGGVAIIIGAATGKVLHIGVRNKICYICTKADTQQTEPRPHKCFKNWTQSSQSMEADIIIDGFKQAEETHSLHYKYLIADGDSSVYARILTEVPVWGSTVKKLECANHVCKCLRGHLEKLVEEKSQYKGIGKLAKVTRVRIVTAVRCAIRMRSKEPDRQTAIKQLRHDILNCVSHIFGEHKNCSADFCKAKAKNNQSDDCSTSKTDNSAIPDHDILANVVDEVTSMWVEGTTDADLEESRGPSALNINNDNQALRLDLQEILCRVADKTERLIGNFTSNLAESWMSIRCKFDGGKYYNRCHRSSWHARCFGAGLRKNLGMSWSPKTWEKLTGTAAGSAFVNLYSTHEKKMEVCRRSKAKADVLARARKRRASRTSSGSTKRARRDYGPGALDVTPVVTGEELQKKCSSFYNTSVSVSSDEILSIERKTRQQSSSELWHEHRKRRITASNFKSVVGRNIKLKVEPLIRKLLYTKFSGNKFTTAGLNREEITITEYIMEKKKRGDSVSVKKMGLFIDSENNHLAASADGMVTLHNGEEGLIELKNVLQNNTMSFDSAVKSTKEFCLEKRDGQLALKLNHSYFYQIQGQLNICRMPWCDLVVRRTEPHEMHIERIFRDETLWDTQMVPKLTAFYNCALLPELASPRYNKAPGIREPGLWYVDPDKPSKTSKAKAKYKEPKKKEGSIPAQSTTTRSRRQTSQSKDNAPSTSFTIDQADATPPTSTGQRTSARKKTVLFLGRKISHRWQLTEDSDETEWYEGRVVDTIGEIKDGHPGCIYEVKYDSDNEPTEVDGLLDDFRKGWVRFVDL